MTTESASHCNVAVIPARGGSKRIPGKNIRPFLGRPIIAYAIKVVQKSGLFDRVVVSTDSEEIAAIASEQGAEVPFIRPSELSGDHTTTAAAFAHALEAIRANDHHAFACCIYPATPFLLPDDLRRGLNLLKMPDTASVFAVSAFSPPIWRSFRETAEGYFDMMWPEHKTTRSQDVPEAFHDVGQFYWVRIADFLADPSLLTSTSRAVHIPRWRSHDIDTLDDWTRAELLYRALQQDGAL